MEGGKEGKERGRKGGCGEIKEWTEKGREGYMR